MVILGGKITRQELSEGLKSELNKSGILSELETSNKTNLVGAINEVKSEVTTHKADIASQEVGKGADIIGLPDPNNLFTATSVGEAMNELFTNVSNGKDLVGGAITGVDDNVVIPTDPTFNDLASAIGQISMGGIFISGDTSFASQIITEIDSSDNLYMIKNNEGVVYDKNFTLIKTLSDILNVIGVSKEYYLTNDGGTGYAFLYNHEGTKISNVNAQNIRTRKAAIRSNSIAYDYGNNGDVRVVDFSGTLLSSGNNTAISNPMVNKNGNFVVLSVNSQNVMRITVDNIFTKFSTVANGTIAMLDLGKW